MTEPTLYHAEIVLAGRPARTPADAREALRRTGAHATVSLSEDGPVDEAYGIWNVHLSPLGRKRHQNQGGLDYRLADSLVVIP